MKKSDAIDLLNKEGWTKADAKRALKSLNFKRNKSINETKILRTASKFAGAELDKRQKRQIDRKAVTTEQKKQLYRYSQQIKRLQANKTNSSKNFPTRFTQQLKYLNNQNKKLLQIKQKSDEKQLALELQIKKLSEQKKELFDQKNDLLKATRILQKNNKALKNIINVFKQRLNQTTKLLQTKQKSDKRQLTLEMKIKELSDQKKELFKANRALQKDNKDLKNVTDAIKLRLIQETKQLLHLENSQIKKGLTRLLYQTLG